MILFLHTYILHLALKPIILILFNKLKYLPPLGMVLFLYILHVAVCILDNHEILRDNHVTTALLRGFSGKKTKYYDILIIITNPLLHLHRE